MPRRSRRSRGSNNTTIGNEVEQTPTPMEIGEQQSSSTRPRRQIGRPSRRSSLRSNKIDIVGPDPSEETSPFVDFTTTSTSLSTNLPVYATKSKPIPPLGPVERLKWLNYPHSVLNKVKTEEELADVTYIPGLKLEKDKLTCGEYIQSDDEDEDGWETVSEAESTGGDWEEHEQLVYVELDDIPSIQELFAVQPDDFLRFQRKRHRLKAQPVKATHPNVTMQFHRFESASPILQIGNRYFSCRWEEPTGSAMFFRKKVEDSVKYESGTTSSKSSTSRRPCSTLKNIIPEPSIAWDNIFGSEHFISKNTYEAVSLADKVLKTQLLEADTKKLNGIPINRQFFGRPATYKVKVPQGYTITNLLAGQYRPKRKYLGKTKQKSEDEDNSSTTIITPNPNLEDMTNVT